MNGSKNPDRWLVKTGNEWMGPEEATVVAGKNDDFKVATGLY